MKAMICEMCNSNDLVKQDGMFVCQHCGTKYSVEEAKKLMGTVVVDKTAETEKTLLLARRARDENNSENAEKYYSAVLLNDPNNWEAAFYSVYFSAMSCTIAQIESSAYSVANCLKSVFPLIQENLDEKEQLSAVQEITESCILIAVLLCKATLKTRYDTDSYENYSERIEASLLILSNCGNLIDSLFEKKPEIQKLAATAWKAERKLFNLYKNSCYYGEKGFISFNSINEIEEMWLVWNPSHHDFSDSTKHQLKIAEKIGKYDPEYYTAFVEAVEARAKKEKEDYGELAAKNKSGCYVATAVYGSYDCPEVWTLRRFRDNTLATTWYGRAFIHTYYAISPTLVKWFGDTVWFKSMWKPKLDRMVKNLRDQGIEDTPYDDKRW